MSMFHELNPKTPISDGLTALKFVVVLSVFSMCMSGADIEVWAVPEHPQGAAGRPRTIAECGVGRRFSHRFRSRREK